MEEHLQWREGATLSERDWEQGPHYWEEIPQRRLQDDDSYDCKLTKARETHQWALAATHLLKERIERLSQSATRTRQGDCWCSHSQGHLRRRSWGCWQRCTKTLSGGDHQINLGGGRPSLLVPGPPGHGNMSHCTTWSHHPGRAVQWGSVQSSFPTEKRLRSVIWDPTDPRAQPGPFPGEQVVMQGQKGMQIVSRGPLENYKVWLEWRGHQLFPPVWYWANVNDHCRLA